MFFPSKVSQFIIFFSIVSTNFSFADETTELKNTEQQPCNKEHSEINCLQEDATTILLITSRKAPLAGLKPTTQSTTSLETEHHITAPSTFTELVEGIPGVAENGQPGLFQVISIRGVSRQRLLTLVDGVRLSSERRAGVAASFIDPLLLDHVQITRGPVSTYYGSGAIGGVSQMYFKEQASTDVILGYQSLGNEKVQMLHWGDDSINVGLVRRKADNSKDIKSTPLNTHLEQSSGYLQKSWQLNTGILDSWFFSSYGNDLGRSNSRFPNRIVNIPREKHTIFKSSFTSYDKWSLDFYLHEQNIITRTIRPENSVSNVTNKSIDWGINAQTAWEETDLSNLVGIDFYTRQKVNIKEQNINLQTLQIINTHTLNNGRLNELALFYTHHQQFNNYRFQVGGRYTLEKINEQNASSTTNNALTGFIGLAYDISEQAEININVGNAFRFASLTERFFTGTTARGNVEGNLNLTAETAITYDFGFSWQFKQQKIATTLFLNNFDDYIERIILDENSLTFVNQSDGRIKGIEAEYDWFISDQFHFNVMTTIISGKNSEKIPLSDIPSKRLSVSLSYQTEQWQANIRIQHRAEKNDPGSGEIETKSANLLAANISYRFDSAWQIKFHVDNLLNDTYVNSSDDLSTLAAGRNFGLNVSWKTSN